MGFHGGITGDLDKPDAFDQPIRQLRSGGRLARRALPGQRARRRSRRSYPTSSALPFGEGDRPQLSWTVAAQVTCQTAAIGAGALHAEPGGGLKLEGPGHQLAVTSRVGHQAEIAEPATEAVAPGKLILAT